MPHCYFVVSTNPRSRTDVVQIVDDIAEDLGVPRGEAPIYFDYVRWKAHVFMHFPDEAQILALIARLKTTEGIRDFAVVDTRDDPAS